MLCLVKMFENMVRPMRSVVLNDASILHFFRKKVGQKNSDCWGLGLWSWVVGVVAGFGLGQKIE